ncbi:MAG: ATP-binding protein [Gammaproteobacteria bacterium]|nr:ATP-binding protein [Gammaproteobacteria bacterium]
MKYLNNINKYLNKYSLETQLTIVFLVTSLSVIVIFGTYHYQDQIRSFKKNKQESFYALTQSIATSIKEDIYSQNYSSIEQKLQGLNEISEIHQVSLFNSNGATISEVKRDNSNKLRPTYRYIQSNVVITKIKKMFHINDQLTLQMPVSFAGDNLGWIEIVSSAETLQSLKYSVIKNIILLSIITLVVAIVAIFSFLKIKLEPLNRLVTFSKQLPDATGEKINMLDLSSEIKTLMNSLNRASEQIHHQQKSLIAQNTLLESRVKERTRELEKAKIVAEKSSMAKSEFLTCMSHELRTPLNAILGFGQILELDSEKYDDVANANVQEIIFAGNNLLELVNKILDLAKIENGEMDLSIEDICIDSIIKKCLTLINPLAKKSSIEIINNINSNNIILADALGLKQVLINLLNNAIKYNSENGRIHLDSEIVPGNRLRISIKDSGQGIAKKDISKLFTPFERLNSKYNIEGTGIGLIISKKLVEQMNGTIGVNSTVGEGSTFWFELELSTKKDTVNYIHATENKPRRYIDAHLTNIKRLG